MINFLTALGVPEHRLTEKAPYFCPLHHSPDATLWELPGGPDGIHFRCSHKNCQFVGSPAQLAAAVTGMDASEVIQQFQPGGVFYNTISDVYESQDPDVRNAKAADVARDIRHAQYLDACHKALCIKGLTAQTRIENWGIHRERLVSTSCGLVLTENAPLAELMDVEYVKNDFLVCPFFNAGKLTHLEVTDTFNRIQQTFTITDRAEGIFLEPQMSWPAVNRVIVCSSTVDALLFFDKVRSKTFDPINPVAVSHPSALRSIQALAEVYLVDHPEARLALHHVMRYVQVFENTKVNIFVKSMSISLQKAYSNKLIREAHTGTPIWEWVAEYLENAFTEGKEYSIRQLASTQLSSKNREKIIKVLRERPGVNRELLSLVEEVKCNLSEKAIGKYVIRRSPEGYVICQPETQKISNFTIYPSKLYDTNRGVMMLSCKVKTDSPADPIIDIDLEVSILKSKSASICEAIWEAATRAGYTLESTLFAENLPGFSWLTILRSFDQIPYYGSIDSLGVNGSQIVFPSCVVNLGSHTATKLESPVYASKEALQMYKAVDIRSDDLSAWKTLFESKHPSAVVTQGIISHMLHHLVARITKREDLRVTKHIVLSTVMEESSMWTAVFEDVYYMFSGMATAPTLPNTSLFYKEVGKYDSLGDLPMFCRIEDDNPYALEWLKTCPYPVIALADDHMTSVLNTAVNTSMTIYDSDAFQGKDLKRLGHKMLNELQGSLPALLAEVIKVASANNRNIYTDVPAIVGHRWVCKALGVKSSTSMAKLFTQYLEADPVLGVETFLITLNKLIKDPEHPEAVLEKSIRQARISLHALGSMSADGDVMLRLTRCVKYVNNYTNHNYNRDLLIAGIEKLGIGTVDKYRFIRWDIPSKDWADLVEKPTLELKMIRPQDQLFG